MCRRRLPLALPFLSLGFLSSKDANYDNSNMRYRFPAQQIFLAGLCAALSACGSGEKDFRVIESIESQDQSIILEYAPNELAFGPADIRVSTELNGDTLVRYEGQISNDGGDITLDNLRPNTSKPGYLWLCLNGVEQSDVIVRIDFSASMVVEEERHCSD